MPSQKNIDKVAEIKQKLQDVKSVILTNYQGISVGEQVELRAQVTEAGGEIEVAKNTLIKLALKDRLEKQGAEDLPPGLEESLRGPTAILYSREDAVAATKALVEFAKDHETIELKIGLLANDGQTDKVLTVKDIQSLADLPSREELMGQLVVRLNSPRAGFVNVLSGNMRKLVYALQAIKQQKSN